MAVLSVLSKCGSTCIGIGSVCRATLRRAPVQNPGRDESIHNAAVAWSACRGGRSDVIGCHRGDQSRTAVTTADRDRPADAVAIPIPYPTASGGLVPSQLWGNWYLPGAAVTQVSGAQCPSPPTPRTCFFQLALDSTTWSISYVASGGIVVPH
jgi:hypothetical protein